MYELLVTEVSTLNMLELNWYWGYPLFSSDGSDRSGMCSSSSGGALVLRIF